MEDTYYNIEEAILYENTRRTLVKPHGRVFQLELLEAVTGVEGLDAAPRVFVFACVTVSHRSLSNCRSERFTGRGVVNG